MKLLLKSGSIKGWSEFGPEQREIIKLWWEKLALPAMTDRSPEIKAVVCELIDSVVTSGGRIWYDWEDRYMTAKEAKDYILNYDN